MSSGDSTNGGLRDWGYARAASTYDLVETRVRKTGQPGFHIKLLINGTSIGRERSRLRDADKTRIMVPDMRGVKLGLVIVRLHQRKSDSGARWITDMLQCQFPVPSAATCAPMRDFMCRKNNAQAVIVE
ncbi:hypothetical protein AURDEDRAFT_123216 [Auricularia subglabra TFB-10046 SS5]|nr:hypothetical protein AURDEDRAFT_123216 [Auricularia subglabra TFB-10046 SS5]